MRKAITDRNIQHQGAGKTAAGKPETYADIFARLYGEPLFTGETA